MALLCTSSLPRVARELMGLSGFMFLTWEDGARPVPPQTRRCRSRRSAEQLTARSPCNVRHHRGRSIVPVFADHEKALFRVHSGAGSGMILVAVVSNRLSRIPNSAMCFSAGSDNRCFPLRVKHAIQRPTCWCETSSWPPPMQVVDG